MFRYSAGRMTVALSFIVLGAALLLDNLQGTDWTSIIIRLWPLLLVGIGVEYLVATMLAEHNEWGRPRLAWGGVVLILLLGLIINGVTRFNNSGFNFNLPDVVHWQFTSGPMAWADRDEQVPVAGIQRITLHVNVGTAEVVPSTDGQIHVHAHYSLHGHDQSEADSLAADPTRFDLGVTQTGDALRIEPVWRNTDKGQVELTVQIPAGLQLSVSSGASKIRVRDLDATMDLRSSVGEIRVERASGSLTANTGAGAIFVDRFVGGVRLETTTGSVTVAGASGDAFLRTTTGPIDLRDYQGGKVDARAEIGPVRVEYAVSPTGDAEVSAGMGSIHVSVPQGSDVKVAARSKTGSIHGPNWLNVDRHNSGATAAGTSGQGGVTITLATEAGPITVDN